MSTAEGEPQNSVKPITLESIIPTSAKPEAIEYKKALEIKEYLSQVVRHAGEDILQFQGEIVDRGIIGSHETSSIDFHAKSRMEYYLNLFLPNIEGVRRFELMPYEMTLIPEGDENSQAKKYYLIIDELDGTTNTKRALASSLAYRPQASVSIGLCLTEKLGDLQVSAVYDIARQETFTAMKVGENFLSFVEDVLIRPKAIEDTRGDSEKRILVVGYSNQRRLEKGQIEDVLVTEGKFRVYDGCRSSSVDVLNVIRGQYDAYIDPRAIWGRESGSFLEAYDIAGVIPIALGTGLLVSDVYGETWERYGGLEGIPIVIARPDVFWQIIEILKPKSEKFRQDYLEFLGKNHVNS